MTTPRRTAGRVEDHEAMAHEQRLVNKLNATRRVAERACAALSEALRMDGCDGKDPDKCLFDWHQEARIALAELEAVK